MNDFTTSTTTQWMEQWLHHPAYIQFMHGLFRTFEHRRQELLLQRAVQQSKFDEGERPQYPPETATIRQSDWQVGPIPADLLDRRVEITGPVDRKMIINALNSGAKVFMADFEDASSPRLDQMLDGQEQLYRAVRRQIDFTDARGKAYKLTEKPATLVVRPRGWHLDMQPNPLGENPISATLFDFGTYFFLNAEVLLQRGSGPYFYLPKLENRHEAALWADVLRYAEACLKLAPGTIKVTVLIETITAAFEMEEILYVLKDHIVGLNAGRWDYIFSLIKKFRLDTAFILPDRSAVTMQQPFMKAYATLLVQICHKRGAHAIGGMSAFIPSKDEQLNRIAFEQVQADKQREASLGYDGTWVAHPQLVPIARSVFDEQLGSNPHQKHHLPDGQISSSALITVTNHGPITEAGVRTNIRVGLQYLAFWMAGQGAVAINHLMEDAATAEISRAQLWQWLRHQVQLEDGRTLSRARYDELLNQELQQLQTELVSHPATLQRLPEAFRIFRKVTQQADFAEFITLEAYPYL